MDKSISQEIIDLINNHLNENDGIALIKSEINCVQDAENKHMDQEVIQVKLTLLKEKDYFLKEEKRKQEEKSKDYINRCLEKYVKIEDVSKAPNEEWIKKLNDDVNNKNQSNKTNINNLRNRIDELEKVIKNIKK